MRTALTIAGSDSSGGAGIQADIKTMISNGVYAMSAITALTAQNTTGVQGIFEVSPEFLKLQIDSVFTDIRPDAVKIGMLATADAVEAVADILEKYHVKTTFFMTGGWVESYPDDVKAIAAAGHDLGNHSENHKQMSTLSADECKQEIQKVHDKVKELTGQDMILFRPPYGDYNDTLIDTANSLGYHVIQWDIDSLDWKDYGADNIVSRVVDNDHLGNGSIILMHNGAKYTPDALERVITGLQEKGYEIVPISQLIYKENYEMDHEGRQFIKGNAK